MTQNSSCFSIMRSVSTVAKHDLPLPEPPATSSLMRLEIDLFALPVDSDQHAKPRRGQETCILSNDALNQLRDPGTMVARKPDVARLLDGGERIGDGRGTATNLQKSEVILGISDGDDIDRRYLQSLPVRP